MKPSTPLTKEQGLDMLGPTSKELRDAEDPFELIPETAIGQLRWTIDRYGDHDLFDEKKWIRKCILELADQLDQLNPVWEALTAYITSSAELAQKHSERLTELEDDNLIDSKLFQSVAERVHALEEKLEMAELNKEVEIYLIRCTNCDGHVFNNCSVLTCDGCQWEFELVFAGEGGTK
jgi:hypothetical protein